MINERYFLVNTNHNSSYYTNKVNHCKYTPLNFLFKSFFNQLKRFTNLYFFIIAIAQSIKEISSVNPISTWIPVYVIFSISILRELYDEIKIFLEDKKINDRQYTLIRNGIKQTIKSKNIKVGDILVLKENDITPADIFLIKIDGDFQTCSIQSSNVDGSPDMKDIYPLNETKNFTNEEILNLKGRVICNYPNRNLYYLSGKFDIYINGDKSNGSFPAVLSNTNFIQYGTIINNDHDVYGVVCYTGPNTKIAMNTTTTSDSKWTKLENFIDNVSIIVFVFQIALTLLCGTLIAHFVTTRQHNIYYLRYDLYPISSNLLFYIYTYMRFFLMSSTMIPISLKLTIDFCKFVYAFWITIDLKLAVDEYSTVTIEDLEEISENLNHEYDFPRKKVKPIVNNSSVIEDLGTIEYLFCDKTGTLTENEMIFKKLGIEREIYGHSLDADSIVSDEEFHEAVRQRNEKVMLSIYCLAVCHSSSFKNIKMALKNSHESTAILKTLYQLHFVIQFEEHLVTIESQFHQLEKQEFEIIKIFRYSYERKRMSVIVRHCNTNKLYMFIRGAPDSISSITVNSHFNDSFHNQVNQLGSLGLRLMGLAYKELDEEKVNSIIELYHQQETETIYDSINPIPRSSLNESLSIAIQAIERDVQLLGLAAVEDKLQDGVVEAIETLRQAGIKIWMLTGDILQTACNISFSSHLVTNDGPFIHINLESQSASQQEETDSNLESLSLNEPVINHNEPIKHTDEDMKYLLDQIEGFTNSLLSSQTYYIGIDNNYELLFSKQNSQQFLRIAMKAKSVICASATPDIKAQIVKLIKSQKKRTLAVGDGGNDIPMIREAHVGIGLIGHEGKQAGASSDICLTKFKFLVRILLIHGRYAMHRSSFLTQFCFYKSALFSFIQLLYNFHNGYSVSSYFVDMNIITYNTLFTLLPVIFYIQDKDICESSLLLRPYLYSDCQNGLFCNRRTIFWWYARALYQSVILYFLSYWIYGISNYHMSDGSPRSLSECQQITFSSIVFIIILAVISESNYITILNLIFSWGNWMLYIGLCFVLNLFYQREVFTEFYLVMTRVIVNPIDWIMIATMVSAGMFVPFVLSSFQKSLFPTRTQRIQIEELSKQSAFEPEYLVSGQRHINDIQSIQEQYHPKTCWDNSHSIFLPITLFCGCTKLE